MPNTIGNKQLEKKKAWGTFQEKSVEEAEPSCHDLNARSIGIIWEVAGKA